MYREQVSRAKPETRKGSPYAERLEGGVQSQCACSIGHDRNRASFILKEEYRGTMGSHHIVFKIRDGVHEPRNADGKLAWTTRNSIVQEKECRITICYKTKDNNMRRESVPITSLECGEPSLQEEAIVIEGEHVGKIVYPTQWFRQNGRRTGLYCKLQKESGKRDAVLFPREVLVRARRLECGPPMRE